MEMMRFIGKEERQYPCEIHEDYETVSSSRSSSKVSTKYEGTYDRITIRFGCFSDRSLSVLSLRYFLFTEIKLQPKGLKFKDPLENNHLQKVLNRIEKDKF
jgi:hypothetical protein